MSESDILVELRAIRALLEWDKADTLEMRATAQERDEAQKVEWQTMMEDVIARHRAQTKAEQEAERHKYVAEQTRLRDEHEAMFHRGPMGNG